MLYHYQILTITPWYEFTLIGIRGVMWMTRGVSGRWVSGHLHSLVNTHELKNIFGKGWYVCIFFLFGNPKEPLLDIIKIKIKFRYQFLIKNIEYTVFSSERRHNATFHPKGIFRHHWISMFTYLFTWKVLRDINLDLLGKCCGL